MNDLNIALTLFNGFLVVITLALVALMAKLYTEVFKQWKIERRTKVESGSPSLEEIKRARKQWPVCSLCGFVRRPDLPRNELVEHQFRHEGAHETWTWEEK